MATTPDDAVTEIRFAVVLNGGVSLAVWMGGVVLELDELIRQGDAPAPDNGIGGSRPGRYGGLMRLFGLRARADVISGTSAGGINGAALALSQVNRNAKVSLLREMWAEQGRMETLLQRPFKGSPASLLRGDDYFLPKLTEAMQRLTRDWDPATEDERPVDLTITTTLLEGARTVTTDALGQRLPQLRHEGRFRFRRGAGHERDGEAYDDFSAPAQSTAGDAKPEPQPRRRVAERLALAARCTASFPGAFEPTLVPVVKDAPDDPRGRPDMFHHVNWASAGARQHTPADRSRFAVDGGALANTPTRDALEAIQRMPAGNQVHRVMLLVYPHAPLDEGEPAPDLVPPTVTGTLTSLLGALLSQGSRTFVDEIEVHNRRATARRATRTDILTECWADGVADQSLHGRARVLFDLYRGLRLRRAARDLSTRVQTPVQWSYERIRSAVEVAHCTFGDPPQRAAAPGIPPLPYVPDRLPSPGATAAPGWGWGTSAALDIADAALDLVQRLGNQTAQADSLRTLGTARRLIHAAMASMRSARDTVDRRWDRHRELASLEPDITYWQLRLAAYSWLMLGTDHEAHVRSLASQLVPAPAEPGRIADAALSSEAGVSAGECTRRAVNRVVRAVRRVGALLDTDSAWGAVFGADAIARAVSGSGTSPQEAILDRLLWLHVVSWTTGDETVTENTRPVDLVQISAQTDNAFASQSRSMHEKLGGADVARFSGFLKRSWRMNDWAWGRCDAATMLCRVLLSPDRVLSLTGTNAAAPAGDLAERTVDQVLRAAFGLADDADLAPWCAGAGEWAPVAAQRTRAVREVRTLLERARPAGSVAHAPAATLPVSLPELAALAAYAHHAEIAIEELPTIAAAVRADALDGANTHSRGQLLLAQHESLLHELATLPTTSATESAGAGGLDVGRLELGLRALRAFDEAGIGREDIAREGTSDQMIRTATTAASVAATLLDSPRSGLGMLKPVTRLVRGAMLVPYWVTLGLTGGGRIARFLAMLGLSTGGLLLALAVFGVLPAWASGAAAAGGAAAVLTAFGYAALRTGTLLHGLVLLTPVIGLLGLGWWLLERPPGDEGRAESVATALATIGTVGLLGLVLIALASLPAPMRSVQASFLTLVTPLATGFAVLVASTSLVGMGLAVAPAVPVSLLHVGAVLLWVLGTVTAVRHGRALRVLRLRTPPVGDQGGPGLARRWEAEDVQHPLGVSAGWSAFYGTAYLVAAVVAGQFSWPGPDALRGVVLATTITFAVVLLGVVPPLARHLALRRLRADLSAEVGAGLLGRHDVDDAGLVRLLVRRDLTYQCLVTAATRDPVAPGPGADPELELTPSGTQLRDVLTRAADRTGGTDASTPASRS
ncbi:MAG: patatin-like protein [Actinomycetota bacterium]|nr:patatin-like protein [Actinomycetota bacterium]